MNDAFSGKTFQARGQNTVFYTFNQNQYFVLVFKLVVIFTNTVSENFDMVTFKTRAYFGAKCWVSIEYCFS